MHSIDLTTMAKQFSETDFLSLGFNTRGFVRYQEFQESSQRAKFRSLYGTSAKVIAAIWEELRTSDDGQIAIDKHCRPVYLLLTFRWLKSYESEEELHTGFDISVNTISKWCRIVTQKIAALRKIKV